jgi:transcription antitermination factor NusA-like protein
LGSNFIKKILESHVPEVKKGEIIIREILRLPGKLSKVLVDKRKGSMIDPAGTCIGRSGERIKGASE